MRSMDERRKFPRNLMRRAGHIVFSEASTGVDCVVRDISEGGAQLVLTVAGVPSEFKLAVNGHPTRDCFVKWRKPNRLGVEFLPSEAARIEH